MMKKLKQQFGRELLRNPLLNKGTAFSEQERDDFGLHGLLPAGSETIEQQMVRCYEAYSGKEKPLDKHIYLRRIQDTNETLFYYLVLAHLEEMMPIIYTPVVGEACQLFHHIYRQARGLFISYKERQYMDKILSTVAADRDIRVIVVTDGERILGLGDQGVGGMGIPIGKLSLYTACGGIDPAYTLPIVLDVGTNNPERLADPEYLGWCHERITGQEYDEFLDQFVQSIKKHFPHVLLQFEDFAQQHAYPLLQLYHDQLCSFNDDIQGTASVTVAAMLAAVRVAGGALKDQRIAVLGAGSAGCGISAMIVKTMVHQGLDEQEARQRFFMVDRAGLLHDGMSDLMPFQQGLVQKHDNIKDWPVDNPDHIELMDVVRFGKPTILLGVSGQPNQFHEAMVKEMNSYCDRPIIFPLSNPTSRAEAVPEDILTWTNGQALVATGSPFDPVTINGQEILIAQCNNSYIFPGMGLAVVAGKAKRVTNTMMLSAAMALSELAPAIKAGSGRLLPELDTIREVSKHIALAVIAQAIKEEHVSSMSPEEIERAVQETMWAPEYI